MNKFKCDQKLGLFYLKLCTGAYVEARKRLTALCITSTRYNSKENEYIITLRRPGLLIGPKGKIIYGLQDYLGVTIRIIEDESEDPYYDILPYEWQDEF